MVWQTSTNALRTPTFAPTEPARTCWALTAASATLATRWTVRARLARTSTNVPSTTCCAMEANAATLRAASSASARQVHNSTRSPTSARTLTNAVNWDSMLAPTASASTRSEVTDANAPMEPFWTTLEEFASVRRDQ